MNTQLDSFHVIDQSAWDQCVANNTDPYGAACVRYAARWASLMEQEIGAQANDAAEHTLRSCAKRTGHDADVEGITGFMYGAAVAILSRVWVHGEVLRRWHNLDTQIGDEGQRANVRGGVLNPAVINFKAARTEP